MRHSVGQSIPLPIAYKPKNRKDLQGKFDSRWVLVLEIFTRTKGEQWIFCLVELAGRRSLSRQIPRASKSLLSCCGD